MNYFPAYIHQDSSTGKASGFFPGVKGCIFAGDTLAECIEDAKGALDAHLELTAEMNFDIPQETRIEEHLNEERCAGGMWFMIEIDASKYEGKTSRINITMPEMLIEKIDRAVSCEKRFESRSGFLAEAARVMLQRI